MNDKDWTSFKTEPNEDFHICPRLHLTLQSLSRSTAREKKEKNRNKIASVENNSNYVSLHFTFCKYVTKKEKKNTNNLQLERSQTLQMMREMCRLEDFTFCHSWSVYSKSPPHTSLDFVAKMLPFFSNSDRSGDGGGVAFWPRSFFWVGSSRSDPWLVLSVPGPDKSGIVDLVDPEACRQRERT